MFAAQNSSLSCASSLVTAAAVSFAGIIGFVGLIVPHIVRIWWGVDYRRLIPLSILGGASVLLFADVLARIVLAPQELPVGIVTAWQARRFFCGYCDAQRIRDTGEQMSMKKRRSKRDW